MMTTKQLIDQLYQDQRIKMEQEKIDNEKVKLLQGVVKEYTDTLKNIDEMSVQLKKGEGNEQLIEQLDGLYKNLQGKIAFVLKERIDAGVDVQLQDLEEGRDSLKKINSYKQQFDIDKENLQDKIDKLEILLEEERGDKEDLGFMIEELNEKKENIQVDLQILKEREQDLIEQNEQQLQKFKKMSKQYEGAIQRSKKYQQDILKKLSHRRVEQDKRYDEYLQEQRKQFSEKQKQDYQEKMESYEQQQGKKPIEPFQQLQKQTPEQKSIAMQNIYEQMYGEEVDKLQQTELDEEGQKALEILRGSGREFSSRGMMIETLLTMMKSHFPNYSVQLVIDKISETDNAILVFYIDQHFTVGVLEDDDLYYFDSYGEIEGKTRKIIEKYSMKRSDEDMMSLHVNQNVWQKDDSYCGLYSFIFTYSMLSEGETFEEACTWDTKDKQQLMQLRDILAESPDIANDYI